MKEVKYDGKIYRFEEGFDITKHLAAHATEVVDNLNEEKVYTHDEAAAIVERFEDLLEAKDISIPCDDPEEQKELDNDPDNGARLYGTEYSNLLDEVEELIVAAVEKVKGGAGIEKYMFSGTM